MKIPKKIGGGGGRVGWCQGGCERRIEFFCENSKKKKFGGGGVELIGCQGGCDRRIEVFGKNKKKKKIWGGGGVGSGGWGKGVGLVGGSQGGCE